MVLPIVSEALRECPVDRAVYHLLTGSFDPPEYVAGFARQDPRKAERYDLVFWLKTPKRTCFFSFSEPDWHDGPFITPDLDPKDSAKMSDWELEFQGDRLPRERPSIEFDTFSPELYNWRVPALINPPPALIFARGLTRELWHHPDRLGDGDHRAEQEEMPIGLFVLSECAAAPH